MIKRLMVVAAMVIGLGSVVGAPAMANPVPAAPSGKPVASKTATKAVKALKGMPGLGGKSTNKALTPCASTPCYDYTEERQTLAADPATAASANMEVDKPYMAVTSNNSIGQNASHTLREMALRNSSGAIIEVGVTTDPVVNAGNASPNSPALFVFSWNPDGSGGSIPQGYNGGNGWVNATNCATDGSCPGTDIGAANGTAKDFGWQYFDGITPPGVTPGWWAHYNLKWVGVYTDSGSGWGPSGVFVDASTVQIFGELAIGNGDAVENCSDIGKGDGASATTGATVSGYALGGTVTSPALVTGAITDATKWNVFSVSGTAFNYGGPGWNSIGENTGVKDRCAPGTEGTPATNALQLWSEVCPDLNVLGKGCNAAQSFVQTIALNTCTTITGAGTTEVNALWNNNSAGHTFAIYRTAACTGSSQSYAAGAKQVLAAGWNRNSVRAIKRTS